MQFNGNLVSYPKEPSGKFAMISPVDSSTYTLMAWCTMTSNLRSYFDFGLAGDIGTRDDGQEG